MLTVEFIKGPLDGATREVRRLRQTIIVQISLDNKEVKFEYRRTGHKTINNNHEYLFLRRAE